MSTTSKEKVYLQDWLDAGQDINEISITYSSFNKNYANPFQLMTSRPVYIYHKIDQYDIKIPIDRAERLTISYENIDTIESMSIKYDRVFTKWEDGNIFLSFGKTFNFHQTNGIYKLETKIKGTLNETLKDLSFLIDISKYRWFKINQKSISFNDLDKSFQTKILNMYDHYLTIRNSLDSLGVEDDLNIREVKEDEMKKIDLLVNICRRGSTDTVLSIESKLKTLSIANVKILLIEQVLDDRKQYFNYFKPELRFYFSSKNEEIIFPVSRYVYLRVNDLLVSNLKLELVFEDIVNFSINNDSKYLELVVLFLLELIKAYDINSEKNGRVLELADRLSEWLLINNIDSINKINRYQVIKRMKDLSVEQIDDCNRILSLSTGQEKISVLILLDNYEEAMIEFEKLNQEDRSVFISYPIYSLLNFNFLKTRNI